MKHLRLGTLALALALAAGPALGQASTAPAFGRIKLLGEGSSENASGLCTKIFDTAKCRSLGERAAEVASVVDFGVDMAGIVDSSDQLTAALASGRKITAPCGTMRITKTVVIQTPANFEGAGPCTLIKYDAAAGAAVTMAMDIRKGAVGTRLDNFAVDHQANTKGYRASTIYGGDILASSAIVAQADYTSLTRLKVSNGFDNCIAVTQYANLGSNGVNRGQPRYWSIHGSRTDHCGLGSVPKAGAGIDIASGSLGVVNDHVDFFSYGAFILDLGAGGQGTFSNLAGFYNQADPTGPGNYAFYIGDAGSQFSNIHAFVPANRGLWVDGFAKDTVMSNVNIKGSGAEAVLLSASNTTITNMTLSDVGFGKPLGTVDAIILDNENKIINNLNIVGLNITGDSTSARYAFAAKGSGGVTGSVVGSSFGRVSGAFAGPGVPGTFSYLDAAAVAGAWKAYTPAVTCGTKGQSLGETTASGLHRSTGRTTTATINVTVSNGGTCTGPLRVSLPSFAASRSPLIGQETALTGAALTGSVYEATNTLQVSNPNTSAAWANGAVLTVQATYQNQN